jgi:hypothetical protein
MRQHQPLSFIMANNKKSFILYCDQKGTWDKLDDAQAGRLIKHILRYVNDENPTAPDFITELAFEPIKQSLKRDLKKWEGKQEQRSEAGKRSAEVRKRNAQLAQRDSTTVNDRSIPSTVNVNGSVSDSVNVSDSVKKEEQHSLLDDSVAQVFEEFIQHRKQLKKPMTKIAISRMISKLNKYDARTAEQMLVQSMENGWSGIFEPKEKDNGKKTRAEQALANIASGSNEALNQVEGLGSF